MALQFNRARVLAVASLVCLAAASAHAQTKKPANVGKPVSAAKSETAEAVEAISIADLLVRYGYVKKDPLALITAAKIKKEAGGTESKATRVGGTAGDAKNQPDALSVDTILARAKEMAGGRADLIALADDVAKSGTRGATSGPAGTRTVVRTRAVDSFRVTFRGGEPARVMVSGDGDSDLDLFIYDEHGNRVCTDDDSGDTAICAWTPRYTGPFTIRVRNLGVANEYRIVHN